jgi:heterodisulfide reductase subunit C
MCEKEMADNSLLDHIEKECGVKVSACFQCRKCSNGCPVVFAMDYPPHRMMRMLQMGLRDELLQGNTMWVCATCETCATRCPNDIEIALVMDVLRRLYQKEKKPDRTNTMPLFHESFLQSIRNHGRVFELGMVGGYKIKTGDYFQDARLGLEMFKRGKLRLLPQRIKKMAEVRKIFARAGHKE